VLNRQTRGRLGDHKGLARWFRVRWGLVNPARHLRGELFQRGIRWLTLRERGPKLLTDLAAPRARVEDAAHRALRVAELAWL